MHPCQIFSDHMFFSDIALFCCSSLWRYDERPRIHDQYTMLYLLTSMIDGEPLSQCNILHYNYMKPCILVSYDHISLLHALTALYSYIYFEYPYCVSVPLNIVPSVNFVRL